MTTRKLTLKQQKTINKVRELMESYPMGVSFSEIIQKTLLSQVSAQYALALLGASEGWDGLWHLPFHNDQEVPTLQPETINNQPTEVAPVADDSQEIDETPITSQAAVKKKRNKPFTPNPIMGYQVQKGKAKIFLDRKASSKVLTLSLDDLKELVNAVEKSERVA